MTPPETAFGLKASKNGWDGLEEIGFMFGFRCKPSRLRLVNYCWSVKRHRKQLVLKLLARFLGQFFFSYLKRHNTFRALEPFGSSVGRNDLSLTGKYTAIRRKKLPCLPPTSYLHICNYFWYLYIYIHDMFFLRVLFTYTHINCCFSCGAV